MNSTTSTKNLDTAKIMQAGSDYFGRVATILNAIDCQNIPEIVRLISNCRDNKGVVYIIGNGGSSATANHMANDLGRHGIETRSLTENMSTFSALANDYSYEEVFSKQLERTLKDNDILIAISASGNSKNILKACEYSKKRKIPIIALVGFDGGKLLKEADVSLHIKTSVGEYGPVEDAHMAFNHFLATFFSN